MPSSPRAPTWSDPRAPVPGLPRPVAALGAFDGLHLGHAALIARARDLAARLGGTPVLLTFAPHPRAYLRPEALGFHLMDPPARARAARKLGLAGVIELAFGADLARMPPEAFVREVLVARLALKGVVVGTDFRFGARAAGDAGLLVREGAAAGLRVEIVDEVARDGRRVSSSAIRAALEAGDVAAANAGLGHRWFVGGEVVHGAKLGRTLGYPTANLALERGCRLRHGIYAVRASIDDGPAMGGVASYGRRPTFDDGPPLLETYLFDFAGDLYGRRLAVEFVAFLRPELRFESAEALVERMREDEAEARAVLAGEAGRGASLLEA